MGIRKPDLFIGKGERAGRICNKCALGKPMSEYNEAATICDACVEKLKQEEKWQVENDVRKKGLAACVSYIEQEPAATPYTHEIFAKLIEDMGGMEAFVKRYKTAIEESPASLRAQRYEKVMERLEKIDASRTEESDHDKLSDEELARQLEHAAITVLQDNPDLFQALLERHGFIVTRDESVIDMDEYERQMTTSTPTEPIVVRGDHDSLI